MMATKHGFELMREESLPEINSQVKLFQHTKTGAELLSLENDDPAKVFGVSFRTVPSDSTGVAHILEHIVLGGSKQYPVKEPFVELLKGSLAYYINAWTFSDKTVYPLSSPNLQDFYNLIDVYLDAVFHPLLKHTSFKQEGWHFALSAPEERLEYHGVVFNEMKGQISNPETILALKTQQTLLPETTYGHHSGGDPVNIPDLTYEDFLSFYRTYYHPSNARFFFYGDDPIEKRLAKIADVIQSYEQSMLESEINLQPPFDEPKQETYPYPAGESSENKPMAGVSWLLPENDDPELALKISLLSHVLMGTPASPLRKSLSDSGLGEEVYGTGYSDELPLYEFENQMVFTVGMKGLKPNAKDQLEALILSTLDQLVESGIDPKTLQSSLNSVEFQLREANSGGLPRGILYMVAALSTWNYDRDPFTGLAFAGPLQAVKSELNDDPSLFETLIQQYLLDNPHRVCLQLIPDPEFLRERERAEKQQLTKARERMDEEQLNKLIAETQELHALQLAPDTPQDLARLPVLKRGDLEPETPTIPIELVRQEDGSICYHDLPTLGITYLDIGFDLHGLESEHLPYVPLLGRAMIEMGTESEDTIQIAQRIGMETGGVTSKVFISGTRDADVTQAYLFLRGKSMTHKTGELLAILQDLLLQPNLDQKDRFLQLALEEKTRLESSLIPAGYLVIDARMRAGFDEAGWLQEQVHGVEYLVFVRQLVQQIENDWPGVLNTLEVITTTLRNRQTCICNLTVDADNCASVLSQIEDFLETLPSMQATQKTWTPELLTLDEGLSIPAQVNYVGKGASLYKLGYRHNGSIHAVIRYLALAYLWEKVRVIGGAYGAFPMFDPISGGLTFSSYRDPNVEQTIDVYDAAGKYLRGVEIEELELTKSIISAIGRSEPYRLPDAQGFTSMARHLTGITDEYRQTIRDQILNTTIKDFNDFGAVLDEVAKQGRVVVMGARERLEKANIARGGNWLEITQVL
jgi:Zn-dependent M16 (insulinase) family peptidase